MPDIDPTGHTVIILAGTFAGEQGVCLGRAPELKGTWAVSPIGYDDILNLRFGEEFGVLINTGRPAHN